MQFCHNHRKQSPLPHGRGSAVAFGEFFGENLPARSTVQRARWPEGSLVAMETVALTGPNEH